MHQLFCCLELQRIKCVLLSAVALAACRAEAISPVPEKVVPVIPDRQDFQTPDRVRLTGWLGTRI
jgi:hypothetical protein